MRYVGTGPKNTSLLKKKKGIEFSQSFCSCYSLTSLRSEVVIGEVG